MRSFEEDDVRRKISGWGLYPEVEAEVFMVKKRDELMEKISSVQNIIARGLGRSYGDSSLNDHVLDFSKYDFFLGFDSEKGILKVTSGVTLDEILRFAIPRGFFLKITPGTKFVTVGGAIASNVHGKNHHREGSFSSCVKSFKIVVGDGEILECSREKNSDLFWYTFGGMGLTGVIIEAEIELKKINSVKIDYRGIKAENLDEVFKLFEENANYTYSVAWIDCLKGGKSLGRSILMLGEHADDGNLTLMDKKEIAVPFFFPSFVLNKMTVKAFNTLYYSKQIGKYSEKKMDFDKFFYPLDSILEWNKMYGRRGFFQYQFVLPEDRSFDGLKEILEEISGSGYGSFLAVLKLFGEEEAPFSFPMKGYTLALDFPLSEETLQLAEKLDKIVLKYGGRHYLSKDSRMSGDIFKEEYGESMKFFLKVKERYDPGEKFSSIQWRRLFK